MAEVTKPTTVSPCSFNPPPSDFPRFELAGEAIAAGDSCYVKTDGTVWRSTGAAANAAAAVRGQAAKAAAVNQPVTLTKGLRFGGFASLTPGASLYLSGTNPGGLADAASTGGLTPIAWVVQADVVQFLSPN